MLWDDFMTYTPNTVIVSQSVGVTLGSQAGTITNAGAFEVGVEYYIMSLGTTDFRTIGALTNLVGLNFTATGAGTGTGTAVATTQKKYGLSDKTFLIFDLAGLSTPFTDLTLRLKRGSGGGNDWATPMRLLALIGTPADMNNIVASDYRAFITRVVHSIYITAVDEVWEALQFNDDGLAYVNAHLGEKVCFVIGVEVDLENSEPSWESFKFASTVYENTDPNKPRLSTTTPATISDRGFVWDDASHADPGDTAPGATDYPDSYAEGSGDLGSFTTTITGLTPATTYYLRAWVKNTDDNYAYGEELSFVSGLAIPTVLTLPATHV